MSFELIVNGNRLGMTEPLNTPDELAYMTEAKRSAERTGVISLVVIWCLVTALLVFDLTRELHRLGPITSALWVGFAADGLLAALILRSWLRRRRASRGSTK